MQLFDTHVTWSSDRPAVHPIPAGQLHLITSSDDDTWTSSYSYDPLALMSSPSSTGHVLYVTNSLLFHANPNHSAIGDRRVHAFSNLCLRDLLYDSMFIDNIEITPVLLTPVILLLEKNPSWFKYIVLNSDWESYVYHVHKRVPLSCSADCLTSYK